MQRLLQPFSRPSRMQQPLRPPLLLLLLPILPPTFAMPLQCPKLSCSPQVALPLHSVAMLQLVDLLTPPKECNIMDPQLPIMMDVSAPMLLDTLLLSTKVVAIIMPMAVAAAADPITSVLLL